MSLNNDSTYKENLLILHASKCQFSFFGQVTPYETACDSGTPPNIKENCQFSKDFYLRVGGAPNLVGLNLEIKFYLDVSSLKKYLPLTTTFCYLDKKSTKVSKL